MGAIGRIFDRKHRWDGPSRSEETEMNFRSGGIGIIGVIVIVIVVLFVLGRL